MAAARGRKNVGESWCVLHECSDLATAGPGTVGDDEEGKN